MNALNQQRVDPTLPLTITLEAQQWNAVIMALLETPSVPLPCRVVNEIVQAMSNQIQPQTKEIKTEAAIVTNGFDHSLRE